MGTGESPRKPRVRFAPSPTGRLHLGSARTALFNWLVARGSGGIMILRLEDTDRERSRAQYEDDILGSLRWMGLDWDEGPGVGGDYGPYRQSERLDIYLGYARRLLEKDMAYRCFCTPGELKDRKKKAADRGLAWRYDRRCLGLSRSESRKLEAEGLAYTIRFRVPEGDIVVLDMLRGEVTVNSAEIDDFVIVRSDGRAGFHLAVVVDDITMKVTHVIRGDDHLTNAVRHVLLFDALDAPPPGFLHHSLLMGPDGSKLSKRHGATSVSDYRDLGYLPQALVNYLALLSWSPGDDREIFTPDQLVDEFSLEGVSASKAIFDFDKLNWIDRQHIKMHSTEQLTDLLIPYLESSGRTELLSLPREKLEIAVESVLNNMEKLTDGIEPMGVFVMEPGEMTGKARGELESSPDLAQALRACVEALRAADGAGMEDAEGVVDSLRSQAKEKGWKAKTVLWPLRLAITGHTVGPDLTYLIMFWGPENCASRIEATARKLGVSID
jgi:nondiscriminating glutamyl-tRNA synthetase